MMHRNIAFFETITPYWRDLQNSLYAAGFRCYYVYENLYNHSPASLRKELSFEPVALKPRGKNSLRLFELLRIIRGNSPQTVISIEYSFLTFQLLMIRLFSGRKFRVVVRCDDSFDMPSHPMSKLHAIGFRLMAPHVDDVILCDRKTYGYYQERFRKGIYFPIIRDEALFRSDLCSALPLSAEIEKRHGLAGKKVLLFVGRLIRFKNLDGAIEAYKRIEPKDYVFVIVGDGELRQELERQSAGSRNRIFFAGLQTGRDLLAWYNLADVFILPSRREPFGAVVNEALIAGCRCLVSDKAGSAGLIDRTNGSLIDPDSVGDMMTKMTEALEQSPDRSLSSIRDSLMTISYDQAVSSLIKAL